MNQLIIKTEGKPSKCEICHQSDVLDVETQVCLRCRDLASVPSASKPVEAFSGEDRVSFFKRLNTQFEYADGEQKLVDTRLDKGRGLGVFTFYLNCFLGFLITEYCEEGRGSLGSAIFWILTPWVVELVIAFLFRTSPIARGFFWTMIILLFIPAFFLFPLLVEHFF